MAVLTLTYGTMAAGKSTMALQLCWQLRQTRDDVEMWTFGDRSGGGRVTSRMGIDAPAIAINPGEDLAAQSARVLRDGIKILVIDEVQFASEAQVEQLSLLVDDHGVDVHAFGLGADFRVQLFPGTARLFAYADEVHEVPLAAYCWCGARGRCNARLIDGVVVREGDQTVLGDVTVGKGPMPTVTYQVLCRRHWRSGEIR